MRLALAACFAAFAITASAAAQPAPRQVAPNVAAAQAALRNASIAGVWDVAPLPPGRLTLTPGANGELTGTFEIGAERTPCFGQHQGSQFVILCRMYAATVMFSAKAVQDPPVATQRSIAPPVAAPGGNRRLIGTEYFCGFALSGQEAPNCLEGPFSGVPAS